VKLILIAALARNRAIGKNGKLPWHISDDLKRFKRVTTGHVILMGRKTFESLGRPLSNRRNVVLSKHSIEGVETYASLESALKALDNEEKVFVIGGGQLFAQTLSRADELMLTFVEREVDGDTFFPELQPLLETRFVQTFEEKHDGFTFADYEAKR
jgi:dihydrofolate reductase